MAPISRGPTIGGDPPLCRRRRRSPNFLSQAMDCPVGFERLDCSRENAVGRSLVGGRLDTTTRGNAMKRREFLQAAGLGLATSAVAAPAIAQSSPEIKWRLAASWPKSLDTLYGGCEYFS